MRASLSKATTYLLAVLFGILLLTLNQQAFGQDVNASLAGSVTDPAGAVIPGAKITLINEKSGSRQDFQTDAGGEYNFRNLPPGIYDLSVTAPAFESFVQKSIELAVNQAARVDVKLTVGTADQTVTVSADASLINYENPTLGGGVSPETLQDFPLVISGAPRSSVTVAILQPGVTTGGGGNAYNSRTNGGIVTGDEALVDGATASEGFMNQSGMVSLQTDFGMSPDITSEVKILSSNYDAQYGNSTSGQLIVQTRSGGERFHGAAYEYLRNDALNAKQYGASTKTPDKENDFGANVGGPIWIPGYHRPDAYVKGYFYFNWEGFQDHGGAVPPPSRSPRWMPVRETSAAPAASFTIRLIRPSMGLWRVQPSPTTRSIPTSKIRSPKPLWRNCRPPPMARKSTTTSSPGRARDR